MSAKSVRDDEVNPGADAEKISGINHKTHKFLWNGRWRVNTYTVKYATRHFLKEWGRAATPTIINQK